LETITSTPKKDTFNARNDSKVSAHSLSVNSVNLKVKRLRKHRENVPENFSNYLGKLNMGKDRNMMVLSANHYYYEAEELKSVRVLVNLKQLNDIKQVRDFLSSVFSVLPEHSYFIGCFFDNKKQSNLFSNPHGHRLNITGQSDAEESRISSRIPFLNMIYSLIGFKTNRYLTKTTVNSHLEEAALKLLDATEIEELTYFCAQKILPEN
jgi:hypothetical protein